MTAWGMKGGKGLGPRVAGRLLRVLRLDVCLSGENIDTVFFFCSLVCKEKVQAGLVWLVEKSSGRLGPRVRWARTSAFFTFLGGLAESCQAARQVGVCFASSLGGRMHCCGFLYVFLGGAIIPQEEGQGTL